MATVITTQPRNSNIDTEKNIKEDIKLLTDGEVNDTEHEEESKLKEEEEKKKAQEQRKDYNQYGCCMCDVPDDDDTFCLYYCISSCFRSPLMCADNCFCGNCKSNCCDSQNTVVDGQNTSNCDCSGCDCDSCDCGSCDCSGCDCTGCDCSGCDCGDCVECCLCFGGLLECCKD